MFFTEEKPAPLDHDIVQVLCNFNVGTHWCSRLFTEAMAKLQESHTRASKIKRCVRGRFGGLIKSSVLWRHFF